MTLGFEIDSVLLSTAPTRAKTTALKLDGEAFVVTSSRKITMREEAQILAKG